MSEEKKYPEPTVGVVVYNNDEKILLTRNPKWSDVWVIPGGHIEIGETSEETVKREIKEETNLDVDNIKKIGWKEGIYPKKFIAKKHFIFLFFSAQLDGGEIKESDEMIEYIWIEPDKALKTLKIDEYSIKAIQNYLKSKNEKEENFEDKYKRALADYQNLLKRTATDKEEFIKFANERLIEEILPVYDNLKLAVAHANPEADKTDAVIEGVKHVLGQFKNILENIGVEEIKTTGEKFDPNIMEAVKQEIIEDPSTGSGQGKKDGMVARELSAGYKLKGKIIRAARVAVYEFKK